MAQMIKGVWVLLIVAALVCACTPSNIAQKGPAQFSADAGSLLIRLYRGPLNHLSAVRRGQCPMYPSDSQYSLLAIRKHGPLVGWMMAFDRLLRCGRDETRLVPPILVDGKWKYYDPVENNDFWWTGQKTNRQLIILIGNAPEF